MFDPMAGTITIVAPAASDGYGGTAVLNDTASSDYVGDCVGFTRGAAIRSSQDNVPEGHGAVFGAQYYGPGSWTIEVKLRRSSTWAASFARRDKLFRATNAMADDLTVTWTESGGVLTTLAARREQWPQGPDSEGKVLVALTSKDPYVYGATTTRTTATSHTFTPTGNFELFPVIVVGTPSATVNISRTSPSPTETLTFTGLNGGGAVTVDFKNRTITQGGVDKSSAISWPSSTWWSMKPNVSNTVTITDSSTLAWAPVF